MDPRISFADKRKIARTHKAKTLISLYKTELVKLVRAVYKATQNIENTTHFLDQLYFLNLSIANIITKGKIDHFDPYLKEEMMKLLFSDHSLVKPSLFPSFLKKELASLYLALTEQRDNLSDELLPLIAVHSTNTSDATDHFMQTCNDRAELIKDFIQFGLEEPTFISDEKATKLHHEKAVAYLKDFYSAKSLKRCLPKKPDSYEEKTLASLIDNYADVTDSHHGFSAFLAFFRMKPLPSAQELLLIMRKTIFSYQMKYVDLPDHLTQMLQRITGLIPMDKELMFHPPTPLAKNLSKIR